MSNPTPKLPRKVLGYDPAAVDEVIAERDSMLSLVERRVRAAEAQVAKLEQQLRAREDALSELEARQRAAAEAEAVASAAPTGNGAAGGEVTAETVREELTKVVTTAEASTTQIIEAWSATRHQIMQADLLWRAVQEEIVRFASWREDVEPMMTMVQSYIDEARKRIDEVPHRVGEALAPAAEAMTTVAAGMAEFAKASAMPLLPRPLQPGPQEETDPSEAATHDGLDVEEPPRSFEEVLEAEGLHGGTLESFGFGTGHETAAIVLPSPPPLPEPDEESQAIETLEASGW